MTRLLLLGPPGTGKTERLLSEMQRRLERGVHPSRIAFVSFTRAAVNEARGRACARFGLTDDDFPLVRTLHSMAFYLLSLKRGDVFGKEALAELAELTNEELTGKVELDAPTLGERGDALLFLDQYARSALIPLEQAWQTHDSSIDWFRLKRFVDLYDGMRRRSGLLDFTDMIETAVARGVTVDADLVLIDEAQDLTAIQWRFVEKAFKNVPELIVSGDDDQGIYAWAGASSDALLEFQGDREVLDQSYRLPRAIHTLATSVSATIGRRYQKVFRPTDREGVVDWLGRPDEVDLHADGAWRRTIDGPLAYDPDTASTWLLLGRTRRQLAPLAAIARDQGVTYVLGGQSSVDPKHVELIRDYERFRAGDPDRPLWHDAVTEIPLEDREYLLSCLRRDKRSLSDPPRVRIDTIHGAKGLEADRVLLLTDINERVRRGMELDPDGEARVWYVGVTRAREMLCPVVAQGQHGYVL